MNTRKEQRYRSRVRTVKLAYADYNGSRYSVNDLSLSGAMVTMAEPAAAGEVVELTLGLGTSEKIQVTAMVRRSDAGRGMGIEFQEMSDESFNRLRRFLHSARSNAPAAGS